jgi:hypothetical protein
LSDIWPDVFGVIRTVRRSTYSAFGVSILAAVLMAYGLFALVRDTVRRTRGRAVRTSRAAKAFAALDVAAAVKST